MLIRKFIIFLLVFLTKTGITFSKSPKLEKNCPDHGIDKDQLDVNVIPINLRNSENHLNYRQIYMQLSVNDTIKNCMDTKKFNLTIGLDQVNKIGAVKIGSTATKHLINVSDNNKHLEITSCNFDDDQVSNSELADFLSSIGSDTKTAKGMSKETIFFSATSELWNIENKISNVQIKFDKEDKKKMCDYRGFLEVYAVLAVR